MYLHRTLRRSSLCFSCLDHLLLCGVSADFTDTGVIHVCMFLRTANGKVSKPEAVNADTQQDSSSSLFLLRLSAIRQRAATLGSLSWQLHGSESRAGQAETENRQKHISTVHIFTRSILRSTKRRRFVIAGRVIMFEKTKHHAANFDFCRINTFPGQMSHTLRLSFFSFSISSEQKLNLCVFKESKYTFSTSGSVGPSHSPCTLLFSGSVIRLWLTWASEINFNFLRLKIRQSLPKCH